MEGSEGDDELHAGARGRWKLDGWNNASKYQVVGRPLAGCWEQGLALPTFSLFLSACNVLAAMRVLRMQQTGNEVALPWERAEDVLRHWPIGLMTFCNNT